MDALNKASIAIRLPLEVQSAIQDVQVQVRRRAGADLMKWVPGPELVINVVSLGEISIAQMAGVIEASRPILARCPPLSIKLEGIGGTPNNLQPRSLWVGFSDPAGVLPDLARVLSSALSPLAPSLEHKEWQSHLHIGRMRQESEASRTALGRAIRVAGIADIASFVATEAELTRASAGSLGPTLVAVERFLFLG